MQNTDKLKVAYIAAGAAGMICGSCLRDNALVTALQKQGCDAVLVPTYTPLRLDEEDVSLNQIFFGGINVFLQQKSALFRRLPPFLGRALDHPALLKRVAAGSIQTEASLLGDLALSMLRGADGYQAKEVDRLVDYLEGTLQPDLVNLTNILIAGVVPTLKSRLGVPVVITLQGDDAFLDQLEDSYRRKVLDKIRKIVPLVDGFVVFSHYYGEEMSRMLDIPPDRVFRVPLGLNTEGFPATAGSFAVSERVKRIGYLARVCPEKGFDGLVESFIRLKSMEGMESVELHAGGWLGASHRSFFEQQFDRIREAGLEKSFQYHGVLDRVQKLEFLRSLYVLSVPSNYRESKGLYVLEALASGVPVVEPNHGAFPELLEQTGGVVLFTPGDQEELAAALAGLLRDPESRDRLASEGHRRVHRDLTAARMAKETLAVYCRILERPA